MSSETATSTIDDPRLFRALLDETSDAVYIIDPETGKFLDANKCAWQCLGCSRTELLNMGVAGIVPNFTFPESIAKYVHELKKHGPLTLESVHQRKDGTTFPVEIRISLTEFDQKEYIIAIARDVTERQRSEQQFQQTVFQYTAMLDTVPAMVYLKDIDHRYVAVNKAFCDTIGKISSEIIGKTDYDILPIDVADEYHEADKAVMDRDSRVDDHERQSRDNNGDIVWVSTTKVPLHDNQGLVNGVVGLVQDVSDIHRSRDQLVQSDKLAAIGTLAAGVAHEINNPIGFINSNLNTMRKYLQRTIEHIESLPCDDDTLKKEMKDITSDFGEAIEESIEGAGRIRDIVADLKSFSRVDKAGKGNANLNEGIQSTLNIVWNELKYKCKVEKEFGDIPDIYCMANQLNQVFMNLLMNAGHAITHDQGLIKIKTWADDSDIYVSIADNGTGIPRENMGKLFEPFFTTKDVGKGTGLGLSLAFDIIKKHGGQIDVKSEVGQGAEFTISLPLEGIKDE